MNEHNTTELGCILEVAKTANGGKKDFTRYQKALSDLKTARIADCPVAHVIKTDQGEEPTYVPCFGHNHACTCKNFESYGVSRYFGLTLIVTGKPYSDIFGVYQINEYAQLTVTLMGAEPVPSDKDLPQVKGVYAR